MKKRTFLQLSSTLMTAPILSPLEGWTQTEKLKNWAGNLVYSTNKIQYPKTVAEAAKLIQQYDQLKILGTRHCFNTIADSKYRFISLRDLKKMTLDEKAGTVTVEAGVKYGELAPWLHKKGFALHNLASLPHISVAGAISTATHGSGMVLGNLSSAVTGLEFVTAAGEIIRVSKADAEKFQAAVVNLGAIGAVTKVSLAVEPRFDMRQYVYEQLPLSELQTNFEAIMSAGYSVSLFTDWQQNSINEVWVKERCDGGTVYEKGKGFFGARPATRNLHPIVALSAENCTEQMGVCGPWYERMPHFKMGFTPSSGKELQAEYYVPREHAVAAINAIQQLGSQIGPHLFISEIRSIAADELWMSPSYQRDSITIHFTWKQEWDAVQKLLPVIEQALSPFQPRPHWGKLFTISKTELAKSYTQIDAFKQFVAVHDPKGKFRNDFLSDNLY